MSDANRESVCPERFHEITENDSEFAAELANAYRRDATGCIRGLESSIESDDRDWAKKKAHALKGSSANIGANGLRALAAGMEAALQSGRLDEAAEILRAIQEEYRRVDAALESLTAPRRD